MPSEMTVEQAVEILNRERYCNVDDWAVRLNGIVKYRGHTLYGGKYAESFNRPDLSITGDVAIAVAEKYAERVEVTIVEAMPGDAVGAKRHD